MVRIDTYEAATYLIDVVVQQSQSYFNSTTMVNFKNAMKQVIPDCLPRVIYINGVRWYESAYYLDKNSGVNLTT